MLFQKSNEIELKAVFDQYMHASDRWKDIEAQKQAKAEIKVWCWVFQSAVLDLDWS